jgi:hypothetical protein
MMSVLYVVLCRVYSSQGHVCPASSITRAFIYSGVLLAAPASVGESFYFMAHFSLLGGLLPGYYMFKPGQGNASVAAAQMGQLKVEGMDGVVIITNSLDFFVGKKQPPAAVCGSRHRLAEHTSF